MDGKEYQQDVDHGNNGRESETDTSNRSFPLDINGENIKKMSVGEEERRTEDLYKKVRGVLNKLTPQKFDKLLSQIKALKVDTIERLQGVINLVHEKAIYEPNLAVAYAKMCMELGLMQVTKTTADGKEELVNFRKLLITRCQEEFEKQSRDESKIEDKIKEIEDCQDPDKKKELEEELEEAIRRTIIRSVGNVKFIGELFKINMFTVNIINVCIRCLIQHRDEESLECLCMLLTTIGRKLEEHKDIQNYFNTMQQIVEDKQVSSRVRFMLQDVIDLRKNKWVPRRQYDGHKIIDQRAGGVATEQLISQILSSVFSIHRKDDKDMGKGCEMLNYCNEWKRNNNNEWKNRSQRRTPFTLNKDKLKIVKQPPSEDEEFGKSMFKIWNKGSQFKAPVPFSVTDTSKRFSLLDNFGENDKEMSEFINTYDDVINANTLVPNNVAPDVVAEQNATNDVAAKIESYNVAPVKPISELKTTQKRWEISNVFMGKSPEPSPYVPSMTENHQDETYRAVVTNDRPAPAGNEAAVPVAEKKPDLPYKEGQWSPFNLQGNKKYDRDFLLAVGNLPTSRVKPANLPDSLKYSEGSRQVLPLKYPNYPTSSFTQLKENDDEDYRLTDGSYEA